MFMPDETPTGGGVSRRGLLRGAAGLGAATVAAGLLIDALATPAAATQANGPGEPIVAHVRDVRSGTVDLFVGTRHIEVHDPELAARMALAAR